MAVHFHPANHVDPSLGQGPGTGPWRERAACRGMDVALFYPESEGDLAVADARAICQGCIVREDCLKEAMRNREPDGVWGGLTPKERRRMRRRIARQKAA